MIEGKQKLENIIQRKTEIKQIRKYYNDSK